MNVGINPDLDPLLDPQQQGEPPELCLCCGDPVTEHETYTEIGERFIFCQKCMKDSVEHYNVRYG